ncbi:hypothetical protein Glove_219g85 [Diversispora epigaea]|uniref:Uncharacterized protein n=1 Tax=Diversispora epigaea TaxID=1348612 RepID=A0A397IQ05_9GLOM|nr:hypothetical protein Glove_219g85 [Diversispora epigaea]
MFRSARQPEIRPIWHKQLARLADVRMELEWKLKEEHMCKRMNFYQPTFTSGGTKNINKRDNKQGTFVNGLSERIILGALTKKCSNSGYDEEVYNVSTNPFALLSSVLICNESQNISGDLDDKEKEDEDEKGPFLLTKNIERRELSIGKYVEKELFELGKKLKFEHAIHSFILDFDNEEIRQNFNKKELLEMDSTSGPQVPGLPDEIIEFLNKFVDKTSLKIRKIIKEMMFDDNYDHEKHYDKDYIIFALYSLSHDRNEYVLNNAAVEGQSMCRNTSRGSDDSKESHLTITAIRFIFID